MKELSHEEAEDLLGAFALDALPADERRLVEAHLLTCAEHREMAATLVRTAGRLAFTVPEEQPPATLRNRVLQAIRDEPASPLGDAAAGPTAPVVAPLPRVPRMPQWAFPRAIAALAAAVLIAFLGGIGVDRLLNPSTEMSWVFRGNAKAPSAVANLTYFKDRKQAVLSVSGLPALAPGSVYEMWLFKAGTPVDAGTSTAPNGKLVAGMAGDLSQFQAVAITVEPGEQPRPTGSPILEGRLTSVSA